MTRKRDTKQTGPISGVLACLLALALALALFLVPSPALAGPSGVAGTALFQQFPLLYQGVLVEGMGG
ncbi:MAG: hypothetical protein M0T83_06095, partial [Nitrospiraceae bacterium]|nr:hypothetical protein [Nitrospiraceae bacterium]